MKDPANWPFGTEALANLAGANTSTMQTVSSQHASERAKLFADGSDYQAGLDAINATTQQNRLRVMEVFSLLQQEPIAAMGSAAATTQAVAKTQRAEQIRALWLDMRREVLLATRHRS